MLKQYLILRFKLITIFVKKKNYANYYKILYLLS